MKLRAAFAFAVLGARRRPGMAGECGRFREAFCHGDRTGPRRRCAASALGRHTGSVAHRGPRSISVIKILLAAERQRPHGIELEQFLVGSEPARQFHARYTRGGSSGGGLPRRFASSQKQPVLPGSHVMAGKGPPSMIMRRAVRKVVDADLRRHDVGGGHDRSFIQGGSAAAGRWPTRNDMGAGRRLTSMRKSFRTSGSIP